MPTTPRQVELLVHIAAPCSAAADARLRAVAAAHLAFEPARRVDVVVGGGGRGGDQEGRRRGAAPRPTEDATTPSSAANMPLPLLPAALEPPPASSLHSSDMSFRSVLDNADSPMPPPPPPPPPPLPPLPPLPWEQRRRDELPAATRAAAASVVEVPSSQPLEPSPAPSSSPWAPPPSVVQDSCPSDGGLRAAGGAARAYGGYSSPTRVLEHFLAQLESSSPEEEKGGGKKGGAGAAGKASDGMRSSAEDAHLVTHVSDTDLDPQSRSQSHSQRDYPPGNSQGLAVVVAAGPPSPAAVGDNNYHPAAPSSSRGSEEQLAARIASLRRRNLPGLDDAYPRLQHPQSEDPPPSSPLTMYHHAFHPPRGPVTRAESLPLPPLPPPPSPPHRPKVPNDDNAAGGSSPAARPLVRSASDVVGGAKRKRARATAGDDDDDDDAGDALGTGLVPRPAKKAKGSAPGRRKSNPAHELEIHSPDPPVDTAALLPHHLVTDGLAKLARDLDIARRFTAVAVVAGRRRPRDGRRGGGGGGGGAAGEGPSDDGAPTAVPAPFDRGYWLVDCAPWSAAARAAAWSFLASYVGNGAAGWGVWCSTDADKAAIKVFCWGHLVGHVYLLLYVASERRVLHTRCAWMDGDGKEVVVVERSKG